MFVAQAHSFAQQARLAVTLAWVAGYTNIVTLLALHQVSSHMSGVASNIGRDVVEGKWELAAVAFLLLACFYVGAFVSGFLTEYGRRQGWESIYVLPMGLEALLLGFLGLGFLTTDGAVDAGPFVHFELMGVAAAAMGLQNATITRISNGVVRTTHMTGVVTDLGIETALMAFWTYDRRHNLPPRGSVRRYLRSWSNHPTGRRLALLGGILATFTLGAALGTLVYTHAPAWVMLPPVAFLGWVVFQDVAFPIAEIQESELLTGEKSDDMPANLGIYHVQKNKTRQSKLHQMPNLLAWAEKLPPSIDVVILDLGHNAQLDTNAALDLKAVGNLLRSQGRKLVLAGVDEKEASQIRQVCGDAMGAADLCVDLDMAFLHALPHAAERMGR